MKKAILLVIALSVATCADGRVYYLENLDGTRDNDAIYPMEQQASRDLDLAFSAGDSLENENVVPTTRKVYTLTPEKPYVGLSRDVNRPVAYYRLSGEPAARRGSFDDVILIPQGGRKLMKLNGDNKGELILELRVIANHDSAQLAR
ncbi:PREDICTED: uncharacterized protein LOC105150365 [Acromyrmex echinatior]|uniref:Uncharacterized protein n=1 Tax=Acromyrmex echinatior TaxID=103372 RepID=F4WXL4_ACREC|nr:PREDICTED: uncharacterized protein LOC105150365 [Acromyrmex echinatior]EGI61084.1 hypothetical protein G5I_10699 [Acromyrmex echinatior]